MPNTDFEVELKLEGKAEHSGNVLFAFDLNYAGVFRLSNIPAESLGPLLMIECPRLLFPFARELIASAISNGGVPPPTVLSNHFFPRLHSALPGTTPHATRAPTSPGHSG